MKKTVLFLIITILICPKLASAHPPKELSLKYSLAKKELSVKITHTAVDTKEHFIKEYSIFKNGEPVDEIKKSRQPSPNIYTINFSLDALEGDSILVKVKCSEGGSKEASVIVAREVELLDDEIIQKKLKYDAIEEQEGTDDLYRNDYDY